MEVRYQDIEKRYATMTDEDLLDLEAGGGLSDKAFRLLLKELKKRELITLDEIKALYHGG